MTAPVVVPHGRYSGWWRWRCDVCGAWVRSQNEEPAVTFAEVHECRMNGAPCRSDGRPCISVPPGSNRSDGGAA